MDIAADHPPVGADRPIGPRRFLQQRERAGAIGTGGFAHMHFIAAKIRAQRLSLHLPQRLHRSQDRFHVEQAEARALSRRSLYAAGVGDARAEHLITAANPYHLPAAPIMGDDVMIPALRPQRFHIGARRLGTGQDDEGGVGGNGLAGRHHQQLDGALGLQWIEIVEIGDAGKDGAGDAQPPAAVPRAALQHHGVLARQAGGGGKPGQHPEAAPAR